MLCKNAHLGNEKASHQDNFWDFVFFLLIFLGFVPMADDYAEHPTITNTCHEVGTYLPR